MKTGYGLLCLLLSLSSAAVPSAVQSSDQEMVQEFKTAAYSALINTCFNFQKRSSIFCEKEIWDLSSLKLIPTDKPLSINSGKAIQDCTAVNEPATRTIYIQRNRWRSIQDLHYKEGIALHEVLSIYGLEQTGDYSLSSKYISFWKGLVSETKKDAEIANSALPRTVVSDYNKLKTLFFSSDEIMYVTPGKSYSAVNGIYENCQGSIASTDPRVPDKVFPIHIRPYDGATNVRLLYSAEDDLPLKFGNTILDEASSSTFEPSQQLMGFKNIDIEYTQTYKRGNRKEKLKIRVGDALIKTFKLEIYDGEQLTQNIFAVCTPATLNLCNDSYMPSAYPSPACPGPEKDRSY